MSTTAVMSMPPFYSFPLMRLEEAIEMSFTAVRTLKDAQLAAELEHLGTLCSEPGDRLAEQLMRRIYEAETARRAAPDQRFDDELNMALSRLERQTNETDRQLVRKIGQKLFDIGGTEAMRRAVGRMLTLTEPAKQALRQHILERRWAGIDHQRASEGVK